MNKDIILNEFGKVSESMGWESLHSPKNLSSALAAEAAKLMDNFRLMSDIESEMIDDQSVRDSIGKDIADVFIYLTVLSHKLDMDPWTLIKDKLLANRARYCTAQPDSAAGCSNLLPGLVTDSANEAPVHDVEAACCAELSDEEKRNEWERIAQRIANSRAEVRAASIRLKSERLRHKQQ